MKRNVYVKLLNWKQQNAHKPIILQGARQVGKTYILKKFAAHEFKHHIYINFEENPKAKQLFEDNLNPDHIIKLIELYYEKTIKLSETLIIFDEIQECPKALSSLKYFTESEKNHYIAAAGSLLGVKFNHTGSFPVGKVFFCDIHPMSFFEFLEANNQSELKESLLNWDCESQISQIIHHKLLKLLTIYIFTGGMPEAVKKYIESENELEEVRKIQKDIQKAFLLDFIKHSPALHVQKITTIWEQIPLQLAKENKKFIFSNIRKSSRAREFEIAIHWLIDAGLIFQSRNIKKPHLPLDAYIDKAFKIFLLDVGLLGAMCDLHAKTIILKPDNLFTEFKGAIVENYVAQTLKASLPTSLYYWTSQGIAELDYIIPCETELYPLEVKSGISTKAKSLKVYNDKFKPKLILRTNMNNFKKDNNFINIPLYLIERVNEIILTHA